MMQSMHKENLTESPVHLTQQRLPATMSFNVMLLPWCQQVIMHVQPKELQRGAVGFALNQNSNGRP